MSIHLEEFVATNLAQRFNHFNLTIDTCHHHCPGYGMVLAGVNFGFLIHDCIYLGLALTWSIDDDFYPRSCNSLRGDESLSSTCLALSHKIAMWSDVRIFKGDLVALYHTLAFGLTNI